MDFYRVNIKNITKKRISGSRTWRFKDYRIKIPNEYHKTANLKKWHKELKDSTQRVLLKDSFYEYQPVTFCIGSEAYSEFDKLFNMVAVQVRKLRKGQPQSDYQFVFTPQNLKETRQFCKSIEFSKAGENSSSSGVEYRAQWSLVNGKKYPDNLTWIKIDEGSVLLEPPLKPLRISLQAVSEELRSSNIRGISAILHFPQFGTIREQKIFLSGYKQIDSIIKTVYVDNIEGLENIIKYKLVFHHNERGPVEQPWKKLDLLITSGSYIIDAMVPHELFVPPKMPPASLPQKEGQTPEEIFIGEDTEKSSDFEIIFK
jgi:hypothetical protein